VGSDARDRGAADGIARFAARLRPRLLATTLLASAAQLMVLSPAGAQEAASASATQAGQPTPQQLLFLINKLESNVDELRSENEELKTEVLQLRNGRAAIETLGSAAAPPGVTGAAPAAVEARGLPPAGLPAVSSVNFKVDLSGGEMQNSAALAGDASVTVPVTHSFGVQLDARTSFTGSGDVYAGGAGQWFWRDPSKGLLGVYGSYALDETFNTTLAGGAARMFTVGRVGVEGDYYLGRVSLESPF